MEVPNIKFSYDYVKGSQHERKLKSEELCKQIMLGIADLYDEKSSVPVTDITRKLKKIMPEKIPFSLKKIRKTDTENADAQIITQIQNNLIKKYQIEIPIKNKKISVIDFPSLIHEVTHLVDNLFNYKAIKNLENLCKRNLFDFSKDLKDKYFYNTSVSTDSPSNVSLKKIKKHTQNAIKNLCTEDKLSILKYLKEHMITEINAYNMEKECTYLLNYMGYENISYEDSAQYRFNKKVEMLNNMMRKIINKERFKNSIKICPNYIEKIKKCATIVLKH